MKMIGNGKIIGIFLLIVFTLQMTGLSCFGESPFQVSGIENEFQLKNADTDMGNGMSDSNTIIINHDHCSCHLSFLLPFLETTFITSSHSEVMLTKCQSMPTIPIDFFEPPEVLI